MVWQRKRTDAIHAEVGRIWKAFGIPFHDTSAVGRGFPDYVLGYNLNLLVEVKTGEKAKYTGAQDDFMARWKGPIVTIRSVHNAKVLASKIREGHTDFHDDRPSEDPRAGTGAGAPSAQALVLGKEDKGSSSGVRRARGKARK